MKKLIRPSPEEEIAIYREFLVRLHTACWTGNADRVRTLLEKVGKYSYARTNGNGHWEEEEQKMIQTLLNLRE